VELYFYSHIRLNPLNAELNPICHLLALLAHHIFHVSGLRVKVRAQSVFDIYLVLFARLSIMYRCTSFVWGTPVTLPCQALIQIYGLCVGFLNLPSEVLQAFPITSSY